MGSKRRKPVKKRASRKRRPKRYKGGDGWRVTMARYTFYTSKKGKLTGRKYMPQLFHAPDGKVYKRCKGNERVDAIVVHDDLPNTKLRLWDESLPARRRAETMVRALGAMEKRQKAKREVRRKAAKKAAATRKRNQGR